MTTREPKVPFFRRWFGGPSKELADLRTETHRAKVAAIVLSARAGELARKASEVADVAKMLRGVPGAPH